MPSLRMYEDQCKADREGADSDASSSEAPTGRDAVHSPLGAGTSPLRFSRASRGEPVWFCEAGWKNVSSGGHSQCHNNLYTIR